MRKFKFRLQGLEDIKGMEVDALRQAFAAAREELKRSEGNLLNARAAQDSTYHELAIERTAQADPLILLSLESYGVLLRDQVRALTQKVAQQRRELQAAQDRLAAKYKEKKALEKSSPGSVPAIFPLTSTSVPPSGVLVKVSRCPLTMP